MSGPNDKVWNLNDETSSSGSSDEDTLDDQETSEDSPNWDELNQSAGWEYVD